MKIRPSRGPWVNVHVPVSSESETSPTSLVLEWNFTYPFSLRVKLHLPLWSQSETSRTPFVWEWNFTYPFRLRVKLHLPLWSQSETSRTPFVWEWNFTYPFGLRVKTSRTFWSPCEWTYTLWSWNEISRTSSSLSENSSFYVVHFRTADIDSSTHLSVISTLGNEESPSSEMLIIIIRHFTMVRKG
jgi:hypothetical protein